jgi:acetyl esterase/lipase
MDASCLSSESQLRQGLRRVLLLAALCPALYGASRLLDFTDVQKLPPAPAGRRIAYGSMPDQFGDLRVPKGRGPHPVVVLIHGGCWLESINLDHLAHFAAALTADGYATWSIEYRRVGDGRGGGWPGTFDDALAGFDHLSKIANEAGLDRKRVAIAGHSAGGQLALWVASRRRDSVRGVVSLSGVPDLRGAASSVCGGVIPQLVGREENYAKASPIEMLPIGVPQWIVTATYDDIVPSKWAEQYTVAARNKGDRMQLVTIPDAGHFELIVPTTPAYVQVKEAIRAALAVP